MSIKITNTIFEIPDNNIKPTCYSNEVNSILEVIADSTE